MFITKKALSRRTVLRGMGATLALPVLDAMAPALTAVQRSAAQAVPRLGFFYVPNGSTRPRGGPQVKRLLPGTDHESARTVSRSADSNHGAEQLGGGATWRRRRRAFTRGSGLAQWPAPQAHRGPPTTSAGSRSIRSRRKNLEKDTPLRSIRADGRSRISGRQLRERIQLRLYQFTCVARRRNAAPDGRRPTRRVRTPLRRC